MSLGPKYMIILVLLAVWSLNIQNTSAELEKNIFHAPSSGWNLSMDVNELPVIGNQTLLTFTISTPSHPENITLSNVTLNALIPKAFEITPNDSFLLYDKHSNRTIMGVAPGNWTLAEWRGSVTTNQIIQLNTTIIPVISGNWTIIGGISGANDYLYLHTGFNNSTYITENDLSDVDEFYVPLVTNIGTSQRFNITEHYSESVITAYNQLHTIHIEQLNHSDPNSQNNTWNNASGMQTQNTITVKGFWYAKNAITNHLSPAPQTKVCAYDHDEPNIPLLEISGTSACTLTGLDGYFQFGQIPNVDSMGTLDVFLKFMTDSGIGEIRNHSNEVYYAKTPTRYDVANGDVWFPNQQGNMISYLFPNTNDKEWYVHSGIYEGWFYFLVNFDVGISKVTTIWEKDKSATYPIIDDDTTSYYIPNTIRLDGRCDIINCFDNPGGHANDRDVILHEYGHHIMRYVYTSRGGNSPVNDCITHKISGQSGPICAWTEGWANFVPLLVTNSHSFDDTYQRFSVDFENSLYSFFDILPLPIFQDGPTVEGRVTASLWDLVDNGILLNLDDDVVSGQQNRIWTAFNTPIPPTASSPAITIFEWWNDWLGTGNSLEPAKSILLHNTIDVNKQFASAPLNLQATTNNQNILLTWTAPSSNGGAPISDYVIEYSTSSSPSQYTLFNDGVSTSTTATITGLSTGISYNFKVSAKNSVGTSPYSAKITAAISSVPFAPSELFASPGDKKIIFSWSVPYNGGSAITDYIIQYRQYPSGSFKIYSDGISTSNVVVVSGLTNGVAYELRVAAKNSAGQGPYSAGIQAAPMPSQTNPIADAGPNSISILENNPQRLDGSKSYAISPATIVSYSWIESPTSGSPWMISISESNTAFPIIVPRNVGASGGLAALKLTVCDSNGLCDDDQIVVKILDSGTSSPIINNQFPTTSDEMGDSVSLVSSSLVAGAPKRDVTVASSTFWEQLVSQYGSSVYGDPQHNNLSLNLNSGNETISLYAENIGQQNNHVLLSIDEQDVYRYVGQQSDQPPTISIINNEIRVFGIDNSTESSLTIPFSANSPTNTTQQFLVINNVTENAYLYENATLLATTISNPGGVFLYNPDGTVRLTIENPSPQSNENMGDYVSTLGTKVVTGVPRAQLSDGTSVGAVYLFDGTLTGMTSSPILTIENPQPNTFGGDRFGLATAILGTDKIIVGAPGDDHYYGGFTGSVYLFNAQQSGTINQPILTVNPPISGTNFGASVAPFQNNKIIVGAPEFVSSEGGVVYVYDASSTGETNQPILTIKNPSPNPGDNFGKSVSSLGNLILVGAPEDDTVGTNGGRVYAFDGTLTGTTSTPIITINNPSYSSISDGFGTSIKSSGDLIIVSAPGHAVQGVSGAGTVYLFDGRITGTQNSAFLTVDNVDPDSGDEYGTDVILDSNRFLIGIPKDDTTGSNVGAIHYYSPSIVMPTLPSIPTNLIASILDAQTIYLQWEPPQNDGGYAITGYSVKKQNSTGNFVFDILPASQTHFVDFEQKSGMQTYLVSAKNPLGEGPSNTISASTDNGTPIADDKSVTTNEDTLTSIILSGSDPENTELTFVVMEPPQNGILSGVAPNLTYLPNLNFNGPDSFTYVASDGVNDSNIATVSITVTPVNDPPSAQDDNATTQEETPVAISVLSNDSDVDLSSLVDQALSLGNYAQTPPQNLDIISPQILQNATQTVPSAILLDTIRDDQVQLEQTITTVQEAQDTVQQATAQLEEAQEDLELALQTNNQSIISQEAQDLILANNTLNSAQDTLEQSQQVLEDTLDDLKIENQVESLLDQAQDLKETPWQELHIPVFVHLNTTQSGVMDELGQIADVISNHTTTSIVLVSSQEELDQIASLDAVQSITLPDLPIPTDIQSQTIPKTFAGMMHQKGIAGNNVTIAIIDDSFFLNDPTIANKVTYSALFDSINACANSISCKKSPGGSHGTAVAQITSAMAPSANLELYAITTSVDFVNAINHIISRNKADIITISLGFPTVGGDGTTGHFRDGTSIVAKAVDSAKNAGITVTVAAGNDAQKHYTNTYTPSTVLPSALGLANYQSLMEFQPNAQGSLKACLPINHGGLSLVSWDEWTTTSQDYDLFLYDSTMTNLISYSAKLQSQVPQSPIESIVSNAVPNSCLVVASLLSTQDHKIHVYTIKGQVLNGLYSVQGSLSTPADAQGAVTTGAVNYSNDVLELFSSQGPTDDNRSKPDICGYDGVSTTQGAFNPFYGTSAATPHIAGAAALVMDYHNYTKSASSTIPILYGLATPKASCGAGVVSLASLAQTIPVSTISNQTGGSGTPQGPPAPTQTFSSLTISSITQPLHGNATINANQTISYFPDLDFFGIDSFTYDISDGTLTDTGMVTVNVTGVNDAPILNPIGPLQTVHLEHFTHTVMATDVDGDSLTYSLVNPSHNATMSQSGVFSWTPQLQGLFTFNVTTTDGLLSDSVAFDINVTEGFPKQGQIIGQVTIIPTPDTTKPTITLLGPNPQIMEITMPYSEYGAIALDTIDGNLTSSILVNSALVNTTRLGLYNVTYTVSDLSSNVAQVNRTVLVQDTTKPIITLLGPNPQVIKLGSPYVELGANITDNNPSYSGVLSVNSAAVDTNSVGSYNVTYTASPDPSGNVPIPQQRTVQVQLSSMVFGDGSDGDLIVTQDMTISGVKNYNNLIIKDGAKLVTNDAVIFVAGEYREEGTGHIEVLPTGCSGGMAGTTQGGSGGSGGHSVYWSGNVQVGNPGTPGSPPTSTSRTTVGLCTSQQDAQNTFDLFGTSQFLTSIQSLVGGHGSDGTDAASSGAGGAGGSGGIGSTAGTLEFCTGGSGGTGGVGAQGASGAKGGGTFSLIANHVSTTTTIDARGQQGINGMMGTSAPGQPGNGPTGSPKCAINGVAATPGQPGQPASSIGTSASNGGQGGIVFLAYGSASAQFTPAINVQGGSGGTGGSDSNGAITPSRNGAQGPSGYSHVMGLSSLARPTITLLGDNPLTIQLGSAYVDPGAQVTDNDPQYVGNVNVDSSLVNTSLTGTYTVTYTAPADGDGNVPLVVTRTVHVVTSHLIPLNESLGMTSDINTVLTPPGQGQVIGHVTITGSYTIFLNESLGIDSKTNTTHSQFLSTQGQVTGHVTINASHQKFLEENLGMTDSKSTSSTPSMSQQGQVTGHTTIVPTGTQGQVTGMVTIS